MAIEVKVPALPESVSEATLVTWHKAAGDAVSRDDNLVDLETEKEVLEVPSPVDGYIKQILRGDGETVEADDLLAIIEEGVAPEKDCGEAEQSPSPQPSDSKTGPAVRKLLDEHGLDAGDIAATGKDGRLLKEDVEKHLSAAPKPAKAEVEVHAEPPPKAPAAPTRSGDRA